MVSYILVGFGASVLGFGLGYWSCQRFLRRRLGDVLWKSRGMWIEEHRAMTLQNKQLHRENQHLRGVLGEIQKRKDRLR